MLAPQELDIDEIVKNGFIALLFSILGSEVLLQYFHCNIITLNVLLSLKHFILYFLITVHFISCQDYSRIIHCSKKIVKICT